MSNSYPRISVITAAYKAEKTIEATIKSVLDQNYPCLEYIVLDGAGDGTHEILERYDHDLTYWRSAPDNGQYLSITEGFSRATGTILCWLNADDLLLPRSLFIVAEIFEAFPYIQWISTLKPGLWDANGYLSSLGSIGGFSRDAFLDGFYLPGTRNTGHWIQQESTFFSANLWQIAGAGFPNYALAGDFALWCEFYKHTDLYGISYPLAGFRTIVGQRSEAIDDYTKEAISALIALRKYYGWKRSVKSSLRYSRISNLPTLRSFLRNRVGYVGKVVSNVRPRMCGAGWRVDEYKFMP